MKEKIFLKKTPKALKGPSSPSPSASSKVRTIFKFAIIALVWIAIIPILWHHRNKGPEQKGPGSKNILLKEEIPRSAPSSELAETKPQKTETLPAAPSTGGKTSLPQDSPVKQGVPASGGESPAGKPVAAAPSPRRNLRFPENLENQVGCQPLQRNLVLKRCRGRCRQALPRNRPPRHPCPVARCQLPPASRHRRRKL